MVELHAASKEESNCLSNENMDKLLGVTKQKIQIHGCSRGYQDTVGKLALILR